MRFARTAGSGLPSLHRAVARRPSACPRLSHTVPSLFTALTHALTVPTCIHSAHLHSQCPPVAFAECALPTDGEALCVRCRCVPDDGYSRTAAGTTLQACFLECLSDARCKHVLVHRVHVG
jgi:hypothetical protein